VINGNLVQHAGLSTDHEALHAERTVGLICAERETKPQLGGTRTLGRGEVTRDELPAVRGAASHVLEIRLSGGLRHPDEFQVRSVPLARLTEQVGVHGTVMSGRSERHKIARSPGEGGELSLAFAYGGGIAGGSPLPQTRR
jgi:hypothetical protein